MTTARGATILLVDDEVHILELCRMYLETEGFRTISAQDGNAALEMARTERPDLVVLDLMLPGLDGWSVCRLLRQESDVPVIMLTARDADVDKIVGLELGADDYLTKPFNPRELVARVRAVLRRQQTEPLPVPAVLSLGDVVLNPANREVTIGGQPSSLRTKEFDLLQCLMEHQGRVLSREQLLERVWGYEYHGETRTVDVHVAHLRKGLKASDITIETVWGVGYKLTGPELARP
jgi:DNA-binding response OmpR family regulator